MKTAFVLRYLASEDERREIERQSTQAHGLHLVANAIVAWNTVYIAAALEELRAEGEEIAAEQLARLTPTLYGHVNAHGTYSFESSALAEGELRPLRKPVPDAVAA